MPSTPAPTIPAPSITVWTDVICPWAHASRPLTDWLRARAADTGVDVELRAFELHPDLPPEGRPIRPGGRLDRVIRHLAEEGRDAGVTMTTPTRSPNSHRMLEWIEAVAATDPDATWAVERALAGAHWALGRDLGDEVTVAEIVEDALAGHGSPLVSFPAVRSAVADGVGDRRLEQARQLAIEAGATATPSWQLGDLVITGLHPRPQFERWMNRLLDRHAPNTSGGAG